MPNINASAHESILIVMIAAGVIWNMGDFKK